MGLDLFSELAIAFLSNLKFFLILNIGIFLHLSMKKFYVFLLIGLILVGIVAIATPGATQSGNQSDVTGPDPTFLDYTRIPEIPQIDRPVYESQLQQADTNLAVSLIEEYQKTKLVLR
jgi:hypothetical protein